MKGFLDKVVLQRALEQLGSGNAWWVSQREYESATSTALPPRPGPPKRVGRPPKLRPLPAKSLLTLEQRISRDVERARRKLAMRGLL